MGVSQAVRLKTPEEIAVQAGEQVPYVRLPDRASVFADRETRLRQLAAAHPMRDFLHFMADLARCQDRTVRDYPAVALPGDSAVHDTTAEAVPPLPAAGWPRDPVWLVQLRRLLRDLEASLTPGPLQSAVSALQARDDAWIELQADRLLNGVMFDLDMAAAPLIAAGLQAYWVHLVLSTQTHHREAPHGVFGRTLGATTCPCCGSLPNASISRIGGEAAGHRYLSCSLCAAAWHMVRIKCTHCESTKGIHYQSLQAAVEADAAKSKFKPAVEAETCDECGHYLKIVHMERDQHVEVVADDLATLTLDLLVAEAGYARHGVNLMLLFGGPDDPPPESS